MFSKFSLSVQLSCFDGFSKHPSELIKVRWNLFAGTFDRWSSCCFTCCLTSTLTSILIWFKDDEEVIDKANKLMSSVLSDMPPPSEPVSTLHVEWLALAYKKRRKRATRTVLSFSFSRQIIGKQGWCSVESARLPACHLGSLLARCHMWVEFVVSSPPAPRVFLRVLRFSSLRKNRHFQIPVRLNDTVFEEVISGWCVGTFLHYSTGEGRQKPPNILYRKRDRLKKTSSLCLLPIVILVALFLVTSLLHNYNRFYWL